MSASADIQQALTELLPTSRYWLHEGVPTTTPHLRVPAPIVARRDRELANNIQAAVARQGLCIFVMPPLPTSALQGNPFVFFDRAEVRVRILEKPAVNKTAADAYDLLDDVAAALQWQPHRGLQEAIAATMAAEGCDQATATALVQAAPEFAPLVALAAILTAHPLQLAARPCEMGEDPDARIIDVIFEAIYGLQPTA